jgi:hypothetical protein
MARFALEVLNTYISVDFKNFDDASGRAFLSAPDGDKRPDMEIDLFRSTAGTVLEAGESSGFRDCVKLSNRGGELNEIFDSRRRKTSCFFPDRLPVDFVLNHAVNRSVLMYHGDLNMVLMHAASVMAGGKAYIFIAPSGGGKSTVARIAEGEGFEIVNDELSLLKKKGNRSFVSAFPCFNPYSYPVKEGELEGIFFIEKAPRNRLSGISSFEAVRRALPEATAFDTGMVPVGEKAGYRKYVFHFLDELFGNIRFMKLEFTKEIDIRACLKDIL